MTPRDKAFDAKALLDNPTLKAAFNDIRMGLVARLENIAPAEVEEQHEIALMLQLLKRLQTQLARYVDEGKLIEHRAKQEDFIQRMRKRLG